MQENAAAADKRLQENAVAAEKRLQENAVAAEKRLQEKADAADKKIQELQRRADIADRKFAAFDDIITIPFGLNVSRQVCSWIHDSLGEAMKGGESYVDFLQAGDSECEFHRKLLVANDEPADGTGKPEECAGSGCAWSCSSVSTNPGLPEQS